MRGVRHLLKSRTLMLEISKNQCEKSEIRGNQLALREIINSVEITMKSRNH